MAKNKLSVRDIPTKSIKLGLSRTELSAFELESQLVGVQEMLKEISILKAIPRKNTEKFILAEEWPSENQINFYTQEIKKKYKPSKANLKIIFD